MYCTMNMHSGKSSISVHINYLLLAQFEQLREGYSALWADVPLGMGNSNTVLSKSTTDALAYLEPSYM